MAEDKPLVGILMGSKSDWETMKNASDTLQRFGVAHECRVLSAHRTPGATAEYVGAAEARGIEVLIAAAGGAAHLAGVVAAHTLLPVLGVPMESASLKGLDSLLATVQMPAGIPVGTLAIGTSGGHECRTPGGGHPRGQAPRAAGQAPRVPRGADGEGAEGEAALGGGAQAVKVLVIGGTRFLGHELAWRLLALGHEVALFNRGTLPDAFGTRVRRLHGDRTTGDFERLLGGRTFDAAVDFAAYDGPDGHRVAEVLGGRVGHYVVISTGQVYLVREGCPRPAREGDYDGPVMPAPVDAFDRGQWDYGVRKRALEDALAEAWSRRRFPSTRLRIPMVSGERDHFRRLERYLWRMLDGGPVLLPDGGLRVTRHVYSGSVVKAILALLGRSDTFGQAYNLAQDETPTLRELLTLLAGTLGAPPGWWTFPPSA